MGFCRALVISPPTLDMVVFGGRFKLRVGGPGLYGGLAFKMMGCDVGLVGPVGYETLRTTWVEGKLGLHRIGYVSPGEGFLFTLTYANMGSRRFTSFSGRVQALDPTVVLGTLRDYNPQLVLISPVYGEISEGLASYICGNVVYCALDLQGFTRVNYVLRGSRFRVVHVSDDDMDYEEVRGLKASVIYYTRGIRSVSVVLEGVEHRVDGPTVIVEDPTGAGDVFTAITLYNLYRGFDPVEAARVAVKLTSRILSDIRVTLEETEG